MIWGIYSLDGFEGAAALCRGFLEAGHIPNLRSAFDYSQGQVERFDAIAIFGLHGKGNIIKADYERAGIPVFIVDYGYLKRTNAAHDWRRGHWQISLGGLNRIPKNADSSRFDLLGLDIKNSGGDPDGYPLLCVQTIGDASHGLNEIQLHEWCQSLKHKWDGLVIRPHPLEPDKTYGLPLCKAKTLSDALDGARLLVTGNSNSGHDALLAGVPAVATIPGATWQPLSSTVLPSAEVRREHFSRCAWGQWTWDEFKTGIPQRYMIKQLDER